MMEAWSGNLWNLTFGSSKDVWMKLFLLIVLYNFNPILNIILYILLLITYGILPLIMYKLNSNAVPGLSRA